MTDEVAAWFCISEERTSMFVVFIEEHEAEMWEDDEEQDQFCLSVFAAAGPWSDRPYSRLSQGLQLIPCGTRLTEE